MTIDQLRYVAEVMKCHSFNKASENLYVSQPAVSVAIRKLESELGEPLFIRNNNGVSPTPFGLELLPFIQNMISLYEQMPIQAYGKSAKKLLRISVANGGFRFFSRAVGQLYMSHKKDGVHLEFHDVTMEQSLSMVTNGTANIGGFAIWSFQKKEMESRLLRTGIQFVPLGSVPPSVSIGPQNPLWNRVEDWVTLDMIQNFPIIYSFSEHSNILLRKLGLYNKGNLITCKERAGRGELLCQTDGISVGGFARPAYRRGNSYPEQRIFDLRGFDFRNQFGYIYNQSYNLSPVCQEFICYLNDMLQE